MVSRKNRGRQLQPGKILSIVVVNFPPDSYGEVLRTFCSLDCEAVEFIIAAYEIRGKKERTGKQLRSS